MQSVIELELLIKTGAISQDEADRVLGTVVGTIELNRQDLEKSAMMKTAAMSGGTKAMLIAGLLSPFAVAGAGIGTSLLGDYLADKKKEQELDESYRKMVAVRPELKEVPAAKREEYFSVLKHVAPTMAKNPYLAANFVQRQAQSFGGAGFEEAAVLAKAEKEMKLVKRPRLSSQIGASLIQQGVSGIGDIGGQMTGLGMRAAMEKSPEELGQQAAEASLAEFKALQDAGMEHASDRFLTPEQKGRMKADIETARHNALKDGPLGYTMPPETAGEEAERAKVRGQAFTEQGLESPVRMVKTPAQEAQEAQQAAWAFVQKGMAPPGPVPLGVKAKQQAEYEKILRNQRIAQGLTDEPD